MRAERLHVVVVEVNHLGDFLATLPLLGGLRRMLPAAEITLVTSSVGGELARNLDLADAVESLPFAAHRQGWKHPLALWRRARRLGGARRPDVVLGAHDECTTSALLAWLCGASVRIGFQGSARGARLWRPALAFDRERHVIENHYRLLAELAGRLNLEAKVPALQRVPIVFSPEEASRYRTRFAARIGEAPILVHPFAKYSHKEWGVARYRELAAALADDHPDRRVVVASGAADFPEPRGVERLAGTTVRELAWLIGEAAVVVGNNSGPINLAGCMGVPNVCVGGPSPPHWRSYCFPGVPTRYLQGEVWCAPCERRDATRRCRRGLADPECMARVSVKDVRQAVGELVESRSKR